MRFEWLFMGYLLMFQLTYGEITILPALGYLIMLYAMLRLSKFEAAFEKAKRVLYFAVPVGIALLALQVYKTSLGEGVLPYWYDYVYYPIRILSEIAECTTMFFVYIGVRTMGVKAEFPALEKHASRNMSVMLIYFVLEMVMTALSLTVPEIFEGYEIILFYPFVFGLIWRILNLWMIITCYFGLEREDPDKKKETEKPTPSYPKSKKKKKKHRR